VPYRPSDDRIAVSDTWAAGVTRRNPASSELDALSDRAEELATEAVGRPEGERAARLLNRLDEGQFLVAVVGEFKRGKSTLVNALLGAEVVPSGVLPLTAVPTEIHYGGPATTVTFQNGDTRRIDTSQLAEYVTEAANPENLRGVTRVEVARQSPLLAQGVVLVDTPGIGSVHLHNTAAGHAALLDADGAVMVLSADTPMSDQERALVAQLAERRAPTFFVLNKADHLSSVELDEVTAFVGRVLVELFGRQVPIYAVDARSALAVRCSGVDHVGDVGVDFDAFAHHFERFVADDLVGALAASVRGELARLGASLQGALGLEQAARNASPAELDRLVSRFTTEAGRQWSGFEDDCTLLDRDVAQLIGQVSARLDAFARDSPATYAASLVAIASAAPRGELVAALHAGVRDAVQAGFDAFRREEVGRVDAAWLEIAETFRTRVQRRVDDARSAAASLFEVTLPTVVIPTLSAETERFTYLFLQVGSTLDPVSDLAARLVPDRVARRRALANARRGLTAEFDKHAGRARWDLTQRLDTLRGELKRAMRQELDRSLDMVSEAAALAEEWQRLAADERSTRAETTERLRRLADSLAAMGRLSE
jgi:GTP-binding protein EngB required for normal cell division